MTAHELQCLGKDLFSPLRWQEFWLGIITGSIAGTVLSELLLQFCK
jgi:hypothetical protein